MGSKAVKSLAPSEYQSLPALDAPAGYICLIRDIDRDRYRLEATRRPEALVDAVLAERRRSFGIELVSVLETDDLRASEAELFTRHHARLSSEWLELDAYQLEELRQSILQIDAYASMYRMTSARSTATGGPAVAGRSLARAARASESARQSGRRAGGGTAARGFASYRGRARTRDQRRLRSDSAESGFDGQSVRFRQTIASWIDDLFVQHPIEVFVIIVVAALICFGMIRDRTLLYRANMQPVSVPIAQPTVIPQRSEPRPTPEGQPYIIAQTVPVYRCASITCRRPALLPERTQIWALRAVSGPPVNGSSVWIEFRLYGEPAFIPVSYLEPLGG